VGPVRFVIGQMAEAMAKDLQRCIVAGDNTLGVPEPQGINLLPTAGGNVYDRAKTVAWLDTSNATRRQTMRKAYYAVQQLHRESPRFVWIANNDGVQVLSSLNDLDQKPFADQTHIFSDSGSSGRPMAYLGKQVVETTAIATVAGTPNTAAILGGDMGQYALVEGPDGLRIEQTNDGAGAFESDTVAIKIVQHLDGAPIIPPAFVKVTGAVIP
jgi:HK97 family phage major capsid protein